MNAEDLKVEDLIKFLDNEIESINYQQSILQDKFNKIWMTRSYLLGLSEIRPQKKEEIK